MTEHTHGMSEVSEFIAGVGHATGCAISANHTPAPMRFIWHHILPQACGGKSTQDNLISLCDSCHYAIHALLYQLKVHGKVTPSRRNNPLRVATALKGYQAALAAGTVSHIPNEGSSASNFELAVDE